MKKYILSIMVLLFATDQIIASICHSNSFRIDPVKNSCCCTEKISKSFMFTRPINQNVIIDQYLNNHLIYEKTGAMAASVEVTGIYQRSLPMNKTTHYFTMSCKDILTVEGDDFFTNPGHRDIRAEWLNLPSDFRGSFSLSPQQTQYGAVITYNQDVHKVMNHPMFEGSWIQVEVPVTKVINDIQFNQINASTQSTEQPNNLIEAFTQKDLFFGRILDHACSTTNVAEINLRLGRTYLSENSFIIDYYSVLSIPTGNQQTARTMFSPVAGNNGHWGVGAGVDFQLLLSRDTCKDKTCFFMDLIGLFLAKGTEKRVLDLQDKQWSRYLLLTPKNGPLGNTVMGPDILTRDVMVHPYGMFNWAMGWRFMSPHVEGEIGYSIWGHAAERIRLKCPFNSDYGIAGNFTGITPADLPEGVYTVTASKSRIDVQAANDLDCDGLPTFVPIRENDLNLHSAASQAALNHQVHAAISYRTAGVSYDAIFGTGFFFDFPQRNAALQSAGMWIKGGSAF